MIFCKAFPDLMWFMFTGNQPPLLYYSHIPTAIIALSIGIYILSRGRRDSLKIILSLLSLVFVVWVILDLTLWVNRDSRVIITLWSLYGILYSAISYLCIYLTSIFLNNKIPSVKLNAILAALFLPILVFTPTHYNLSGINLQYCGAIGFEGLNFLNYYTFIGILAFIWIFTQGIFKIFKSEKSGRFKNILFISGIEFFLLSFFLSSFLASYLVDYGLMTDYGLEQYGLLGMVAFLAMIAYLIVHYKMFNIKIIGIQALLVTEGSIIASLLFIQRLSYMYAVIAASLIIYLILSIITVRGVKREIEAKEREHDQREKIEKLAVDLEKANAQLKELDRQKDELMSIVSHQLAAPVTSIKWYLELLREGDLGVLQKEQRESIDTMQGVTTNLADLVSMILDVSRIQLGRMRIEAAPLDLKEFFHEILATVEPKALEKKINFSKSLPASLPTATLDKRYTRMTIENLLTNAIKYTPSEGKVEMKVEVRGDKLWCAVTDTGVGIPKAEQDKIFGKLFRASNVRNNVDGNGFGLYVAKGAIEAQGGKIWFESEEGKGTTFFVELPLVQADGTVTGHQSVEVKSAALKKNKKNVA
ncbi:MAG: HAMP domain-containing sensor histidine kinase [Candidatus Peribacteraceae bacterium]|nr:HAMP domain-containing sensor histidine kinase [Candidatus Peribacteraceae bacterium]